MKIDCVLIKEPGSSERL